MTTPESTPRPYALAVEADLPLVSVLIPVRNEEGFIGRCLQALAAQDYPRDLLEVFVIDGQSTDTTENEAKHMAELAGITVFYVPNPRRTTAAGLNLGLTLAHGQVIVRVDGHTRVEPDFISANVNALASSGAAAVGGPIQTRGHGNIGRAIALAMSSPFGVGGTAFRHSQTEQWTDTAPFAAYRREVFDQIGGFAEDIDYGEDDEFNYRLRAAGGRILLTPAVRSTYFSRDSYRGLIRQYWGYGLAKAEVLRRHPSRLRPRHLIPPALVLVLAGGTLLGGLDKRCGRVAALAAGAYAAANAGASLKTARGASPKERFYLAAAFASIHLAAGAGMLAGVARLFLRGRAGRDEH